MHEGFSFGVDEHRAERTHLLRHERAENLGGIGNAGRVILDGVGIDELRADAVAEDQAVGRRAVVVRGREALVVQPSGTAGRDNHGLGPRHLVFAGIIIHQDGSCRPALFVQDQLQGGSIVYRRNAPVHYLVTQDAHYLRACVVGRGVHALTRGTAAVGGHHHAVGILVEHHAEVVQPLDCERAVVDKPLQKHGNIRVVSAAYGVKIMDRGGVVLLIRALDAAFGHHGVGVADSELGHDEHLRSGPVRFDGGRGTCAPAPDNQYVDVVVDNPEVDCRTLDAAVRLQ